MMGTVRRLTVVTIIAALVLAATDVGNRPAVQGRAPVGALAAVRHESALSCSPEPTIKHDKVVLTARLGSATAILTARAASAIGYVAFGVTDPTLAFTGVPHPGRAKLPALGPTTWSLLTALAPFQLLGPSLNQMHLLGPLCLANVAGLPGPTALVAVYTGGAHCCSDLVAYELSNDNQVVTEKLGNPPLALTVSANRLLIVSGDNAFAYLYTDYADSAFPLLVLQFANADSLGVGENMKLVNSTRQHPALLSADAADQWAWSQRRPSDNLGFLAAWTADECNLNRCGTAFATLAHLAAVHRLRTMGAGTVGLSWVQGLRRFLVQHGYATGGR
jgi:hypothetical protein